MRLTSRILVLILVIGVCQGYAAVTKDKNIQFQQELKESRENLGLLKQRLQGIEQNFWGGQKKLLNAVNVKRNIELTIDELFEKIRDINARLDAEESKLPKVARMDMLSRLYADTAPGLIVQVISSQKLQESFTEIKKQKSELINLKKEYDALNIRFQEYVQIEAEIAQLLDKVQTDKKQLLHHLEEERLREMQLANRIRHQKSISSNEKTTAVSNVKGLKLSPDHLVISDWAPVKNGITYKINLTHQGKELISPWPGKIVYQGKLSTYGNVVIMEHSRLEDKNLRSIFMGDIEITSSTGSIINAGEKIGKITIPQENGHGLYFELRNGKNPISYTNFMPEGERGEFAKSDSEKTTINQTQKI